MQATCIPLPSWLFLVFWLPFYPQHNHEFLFYRTRVACPALPLIHRGQILNLSMVFLWLCLRCLVKVEALTKWFVFVGRHKRLLQVQAQSKRNPHYQTLERDLIEFQEQQLFELFVVVSLQKKPSETTYTPQIIQQFPSKVCCVCVAWNCFTFPLYMVCCAMGCGGGGWEERWILMAFYSE